MLEGNWMGVRRRRFIAALGTAIAACGFAAAMVVASLGSSPTHAASPQPPEKGASTVFSVLGKPPATSMPYGVPSGAVLAQATAKHSVYVWSGTSANTPLDEGTTVETCIFSSTNGASAGQTCSPTTVAAERGLVSIQRNLKPTREPLTVTVLVPNGVEVVTFTESTGEKRSVTVKDNTVVVEDDQLASPPASAVSYTLPDGRTESVPLPVEEPTS